MSTSRIQIGDWLVDPDRRTLSRDGNDLRLEPKVMDLLLLLAERQGQVVSRAQVDETLWPDVIVGEDTIARTVSKLRRALGDEAKQGRYVETVPKSGYRLAAIVSEITEDPGRGFQEADREKRKIQPVVFVLLAIGILSFALILGTRGFKTDQDATSAIDVTERAHDHYMRFTRADNETAIALYQQVIVEHPDYAPAQAGLSNALIQRTVRWSEKSGAIKDISLTKALQAGILNTDEAQAVLERAANLAERAVRMDGKNAGNYKALGFAYSAQGRLDEAEHAYNRAIKINPEAWDVLVNLGEIHMMRGDHYEALTLWQQAYFAMDKNYDQEPQRVGHWHADLGVLIGKLYDAQSQSEDAELWYRRVLKTTPLHRGATVELAALLNKTGRASEAEIICIELADKLGTPAVCE